MVCHVVACMGETNLTTSVIFHVSGILACETLMFICGGGGIMSSICCFCFKDTVSNADQMLDLKTQNNNIKENDS